MPHNDGLNGNIHGLIQELLSECEMDDELKATLAAIEEQLLKFDKTKVWLTLVAAVTALEGATLTATVPPKDERAEKLRLWILALTIIESNLDPSFNPDDLPETAVMPPPVDGVQYPPGADPALITDPAARAKYEKAIRAGIDKTNHYNLQVRLRRMDERATTSAWRFVTRTFSKSLQSDADEFKAAVLASKLSPARQAACNEWLDAPTTQTN